MTTYAPAHVSAPGKVLISGGYQILQRPLPGLVFTTDCRFHAHCAAGPDAGRLSAPDAPWKVRVDSEQLQEHSFYRVRCDPAKRDVSLLSGPANPFVLNALRAAFAVAGSPVVAAFLSHNLAPNPEPPCPSPPAQEPPCLLVISVQGDNAFYAQTQNLARLGLPLSPESLQQLPPFQPISRDAQGNLQKTGLGSSAALTVSVIGALSSYLLDGFASSNNIPTLSQIQSPLLLSLSSSSSSSSSSTIIETTTTTTTSSPSFPSSLNHPIFDLSPSEQPSAWRQLVYQASQAAHCAAQGKIGSGFDVSAAVFGSHRYVRFSPQLLEPLLQLLADGLLLEPLDLLLPAAWDDERVPLRCPAPLKLVLADVSAGSNTPAMVRKVLDGLQQRADATGPVWARLSACNAAFEGSLKALGEERSGPAEVREAFEAVREQLKLLGVLCDVPIEPPEQTALLDSTLGLPGVVFAGVPGAGGYDAVFAAVIDDRPEIMEAIDRHWAAYPTSVWRLAVTQDDRGILIIHP